MEILRNPVDILWTSSEILRKSHRDPMEILWKAKGNLTEILGISYGTLLGIRWKFCKGIIVGVLVGNPVENRMRHPMEIL